MRVVPGLTPVGRRSYQLVAVAWDFNWTGAPLKPLTEEFI